MLLTSQQVKGILKVGDTRLRRLVESGKLKPTNSKKPGAKKFFARFDSKEVEALRKELKVPPPVASPREVAAPASVDGIRSTLARIEEKIDALAKLWA